MSIFAINVDFGEEIKSFVDFYTFGSSKSFDFLIGSRFLGTKLVARESKDA